MTVRHKTKFLQRSLSYKNQKPLLCPGKQELLFSEINPEPLVRPGGEIVIPTVSQHSPCAPRIWELGGGEKKGSYRRGRLGRVRGCPPAQPHFFTLPVSGQSPRGDMSLIPPLKAAKADSAAAPPQSLTIGLLHNLLRKPGPEWLLLTLKQVM